MASNVSLIGDGPIFRHRGVMLDLARHFLPIHTIKSTIR
jgi:N-acetyl-beta-hexosaminidase